MSVPPPVDPPTMPTMVSRLPKFGSRPTSGLPSGGAQTGPAPTAASCTRLTNGFYHHPGPVGVNAPAAVKQNGFLRVPASFSMSWRNDAADAAAGKRPGKTPPSSQRHHGPGKTSPSSAGRGRGFGFPTSSSSPQSGPRTVSKGGPQLFRPGQAPSGPSAKPVQNGLSRSRPWSGSNSSLRQPQSFGRPGSGPGSGPGSRSGSPQQKKAGASRCHSTDSLGSAPPPQLTDSDRFRSRSLTQVQRQPSPTLPPSSRTGPAQAPPTGRGGGVKGPSSSLLPPSALKKPLLLSLGHAPKPSGISYKLSRPSLNKQPRPLRVTSDSVPQRDQEVTLVTRRDSVETPPTGDTGPGPGPGPGLRLTGSRPETPETLEALEAPRAPGLAVDPVSQGEASTVGETLEDMSLSSNSSLDRNDTSPEFMDDFDNLGSGILLLSSKNDDDDSGLDRSCARFDDVKMAVNGVSKATGLCFLDDGVDWSSSRLGGDGGEHQLNRRRRRSSQPDFQDQDQDQGGSSLDLSPSDSCGSGGTYMWDEEGLEPLGGANTSASIHTNDNISHHIGSFDSDVNSIDVLNNLENCDLDDDDLMLDADVLEDASLHSDADGISHLAQWRRRQICWGTQDVHSKSDFYKLTEDPGNQRTDPSGDRSLILDLSPPRSLLLSPVTSGLGLDVEELAEDCSAVRSQLEHLHRLLLQEEQEQEEEEQEEQEEEEEEEDTLSPEADTSSHSTDAQVQALLTEVQQLRAELRSRDQTIAELSQQLAVPMATTRCHCQEATGRTDGQTQTSVWERESVASQTPWRESTSQVLHSSVQEDQEPLKNPVPAPPPPSAPLPVPDRHDCPEGGRGPGRREEAKAEVKERRGAFTRSLRRPQPSQLHLFLSSSSSSTPDSSVTSGVKTKTTTSGSSRLPKPKSH